MSESDTSLVTVIFMTNGMKTVTAEKNSNLLRISLREQGGFRSSAGAGCAGHAGAISTAVYRIPTP